MITMGDLISPAAPMEATQAPFTDMGESNNAGEGSSAKIDQLIQLLTLTPYSEKSLVFSQFTRFFLHISSSASAYSATSFLDKIAERLEDSGIAYVRFDGQTWPFSCSIHLLIKT